jgi:hypothetical protein
MNDGWEFLSVADAQAMEAWKKDFMSQALDQVDMIQPDQAAAIEEMIKKQGASWLIKSLSPKAVKKNMNGKLLFTSSLTKHVLLPAKVITEADRKQALTILAPSTIEGIQLHSSGCGDLAGLVGFLEGLVAAELRNELTQIRYQISRLFRSHKFGSHDLQRGWDMYDFLRSLTADGSPAITTAQADWYKDLVLSYMRSVVGFEPEMPRTWTQPRKGCGMCDACKILDEFLVDPDRATLTLSKPLPIRKHLADRLGCHFIDTRQIRDDASGFTLRTIADKSPHKLEITKRHSLYEQQHAAWKVRADRARRELRKMSSPQRMRYLLGAGVEDILSLRIVTLQRDGAGRADGNYQAAFPRMSHSSVAPSPTPPLSSPPTQGAMSARNANGQVSLSGASARGVKRPAAPEAGENQTPSKRPTVIDLTG